MSTKKGLEFGAIAAAMLLSMPVFFSSCGDDSTAPTDTRTEVIELSQETAVFSIDVGDADPTPQTIWVTNSEPGTLYGLDASIAYGVGEPTGWLSAILGGTIAPADLSVQPTTSGGTLGAGTYTATISVTSNKANNSPQQVDVTFTVVAKYGFYTEGASTQDCAPNYLNGNKITVAEASTLTHLCLIGKAAGPQVKLALYMDVSGEPGQLVASTPATTIVDGELEIPVAEAALPAGDYWIAAVYNTIASIGMYNYGVVNKYVALAFGSALPGTFPAATTATGPGFNYYIKAIVP